MVSALSALGSCPYARPTRHAVCKLVTSNSQNGIFRPLCFQSLAHSFAASVLATPLQSAFSALFAENTGGGYTLKIRLMYSRIYALLPRLPRAHYVRGADPRWAWSPRPATRSSRLSRSSRGAHSARGNFPPVELCFRLTPLEATLTKHSASVHSKRLTARLSRLEYALTKKPGVGGPCFFSFIGCLGSRC